MKEKLKIIIYKNNDGKEPINDWLKKIDPEHKKRIFVRLNRLQDNNLGDCKLLKKIYELRFFFGAGYRIYFAKENRNIILLYAGNKNTQSKDIKKAQEFYKDYKYG